MKEKSLSHFRYQVVLSLLAACALLLPQTGFAASTGQTAILRQIGSGAATASGDYISSSLGAGLDLTYRYYIEVPAGVSNLTVEIYDADTGAVANYSDWQIGGAYNTSCTYTLNRPDTTNAATATYDNTQIAADNVWTQLYTVANPAAGHWQLIVDMSSAVTVGDDVNGYGIRAHDGTPGAGGTEFPIYAESFLPLGVIGLNPTTITTTFYPYVTSGCTVGWNDFDGDNGTNMCRLSYTSRAGAIPTTTYSGAGNDVWLSTPITGFRTANNNVDSGIWTANATYTTLSGSTANFGVFWAGNWQAATGAPSTQPEANSFRVYLPTDGGGAPAKPYLTQHMVIVSGSNPPVSGGTTYVRIIIDFVNPTAKSVTFSAANLVTVRVPGGRVRYRGAAYAGFSQGSITDQPADLANGAHNITWNPGSVAAGSTAELFYELRIIPSANNQTNNVTGTPAANGTTARYVDETGNTTQTRATYTFGPLCELSTYSGNGGTIPTWVAVTCFEPCAEEGQPTVEWHTDTELGAVAFNLWRQDRVSKEFVLVNPAFLPALPSSPNGGVYRMSDPGAQFNEPVVYRLEEIDALGRTLSYGPFTVTFGAQSGQRETESLMEKIGREAPSTVYGFQRFNAGRSAYESDRLHQGLLDRQAGAAQSAPEPLFDREHARITVKGRGLFYVTSAQIALGLGISVMQAESSIQRKNLILISQGKDTTWLADNNGAGIFFYSAGVETAYTDQNVFWLTKGPGVTMATISAGNAGAADPGQSFRESLHFEENQYAATAIFSDPTDDIWLWDYVEGGGETKSFPVTVPGALSSGTATLVVKLKGATDTETVDDHRARISLNGTEIGGAIWDGTEGITKEISFDSSLLIDGANTISIRGTLNSGAPYSLFYVESFDLSYQRRYKAVDNTLLCRGDGNAVVTVTGFTDPQVAVFDVSDPAQPKQITGVAPDVSGRVTFVPRAAESNYLLIALNASLRPLAVKGSAPARLDEPGLSAEYVVITPEQFRDTAQKLADYRKSKGLTTFVATLEEIYESFNFGLASPYAIRDFLANAYINSGTKQVKYAVLIGKGTYDYKDYLAIGDNLCPIILADTPEGLCAADKEFGDVTGKDGVPEIAIGRLPVISNSELESMIDKIKIYESSQGPWNDVALMIADNADDGGDFASGSDDLATLATGYQVQTIYLDGPAQAGNIRDRIIDGFNAGAGLVNYIGHGGVKQLAQEDILNYNRVALLQNGGQLPLMVMLSCVTGRVDLPGITSLGEALLLNKNGGIAGGLAPAGAAMNADSIRLGEEFYKAIFRGREPSAGLALLAAMKNYIQLGGNPYLLSIYNWLGDPALGFK
jgi:hypothetical protein